MKTIISWFFSIKLQLKIESKSQPCGSNLTSSSHSSSTSKLLITSCIVSAGGDNRLCSSPLRGGNNRLCSSVMSCGNNRLGSGVRQRLLSWGASSYISSIDVRIPILEPIIAGDDPASSIIARLTSHNIGYG